MILNKISDLRENQCYYTMLKKGITENYKRYLLNIHHLITPYKARELTVRCEDIKQIDFHSEAMIIYLHKDSVLLKYEDLKYFKLLYKGG